MSNDTSDLRATDNYSVPPMIPNHGGNVPNSLEFSELLQILDDRGITIRLNADGKIEVAAAEPPEPALEAALRAHRAALVELLSARQHQHQVEAGASPEPHVEPEPPGAVAGDVAEVQPPAPRGIVRIKPDLYITADSDTFYHDLSFTSMPHAPY